MWLSFKNVLGVLIILNERNLWDLGWLHLCLLRGAQHRPINVEIVDINLKKLRNSVKYSFTSCFEPYSQINNDIRTSLVAQQ